MIMSASAVCDRRRFEWLAQRGSEATAFGDDPHASIRNEVSSRVRKSSARPDQYFIFLPLRANIKGPSASSRGVYAFCGAVQEMVIRDRVVLRNVGYRTFMNLEGVDNPRHCFLI
jgi:hypothetical protein